MEVRSEVYGCCLGNVGSHLGHARNGKDEAINILTWQAVRLLRVVYKSGHA